MDYVLSLAGEGVSKDLSRHFTGVGLIRGEYFFRRYGMYSGAPLHAIGQYLDQLGTVFNNSAIWYRMSDLWSDEANTLKDNTVVMNEQNPLVGLRGVRRHFLDQEHFHAELDVVIRASRANENINLLVPFVQDAEEFSCIAKMCRSAGWTSQIGTMIEIPCALMEGDEFIRAGATNLMVGLNDLTSLFLGRDRGDPSLKLHPTLWNSIRKLSDICGPNARWGIAGSLSSALINEAREAKAHYACVHYAEAGSLVGIDAHLTPDLALVKSIKDQTNQAKHSRLLSPPEEGI